MTAKLYIRRGGGASVDTEYTQLNPSLRKGAPFFDHDQPLVQLGMRFEQGEASQGYCKIMDPEAEVPTATFRFPPHAMVTLTEDAPGSEIWLSRGRVAPLESGRGDVTVANEIEHDITVNDGNMDLRGQPFTEEWVRPAETDVARVNALADYILSGAASTAPESRVTCDITVAAPAGGHLCPNSDTVTMPRKTYPAGTQPIDVIADCAETAGKVFGVVIHHTGGSHLCLLYIVIDDHTTFATPVKISQALADFDPDDPTAPVFEPVYDMGKAQVWEHDKVMTALVSRWGGTNDEPAVVFVDRPGLITDYEYWGETFDDAESKTEAQAELRANAILDGMSPSDVTNRVSIVMSPSQTDLICAGMSLEVKGAPLASGPALGTYVTRRIAQLQWEPHEDGRWWAHLQLGRGLARRGPRSGGGQPKSTSPKPAPACEPDTPGAAIHTWDFEADTNPSFDNETGLVSIALTAEDNASYCPFGAPICGWAHSSYNATDQYAVTAGTTYSFAADMRWRFGVQGDFDDSAVYVRWYSSPGVEILPFTALVSFVGRSTGVSYHVTNSAVAPVGATLARLVFRTSCHADNIVWGSSGTTADNPDDCFDYGDSPSESPHYLPADTVADRLNQLADAIAELDAQSSDDLPAAIPAHSALFPDSVITSTKDAGNPTFNFNAIVENIVKVEDTYYGVYMDGAAEPTLNLATATDRDGPWTAYVDNPIFEEADCTWKAADTDLYAPEIVEDDGTFYLFYSVADDDDGTNGKIGVATASQVTGPYTDSGAAILSTGAAGLWDSLRVGEQSVIHHDGRWVMAYMGEDTDFTYQTSEKVGIATAASPTGPWTKAAGNPLIDFGSGGTWDDALIADPCLFFENGHYWIMYAGAGDSNPATSASQGLAYTTDPTGTWTRHASNPILEPGAGGAWDDVWAFRGAIWIEDGLIGGIYAGYPGGGNLADIKGGNFRLSVTAPPAATVPEIMDLGHWEVLVSGTAPPVAVTNEAADDWLYGWISG